MTRRLLFLLSVLSAFPDSAGAAENTRGISMCNEKTHVVRTEASELQKFARWFHQDYSLIFDDFHAGAAMYLEKLSDANRALLRSQLASFLVSHQHDTTSAVRKAWFALGAEAWDHKLDLRTTLEEFLDMM